MSAQQFLVSRLDRHQLTQGQLAKATGVKQQIISRIVIGQTKAHSRDTAVALAEFFKCSPDATYGDKL